MFRYISLALTAVSAVAALGLTLSTVSVSVAQPASVATIADGAYTDEQADRAKSTFASSCASCHGEALGGGASAPPLMGFPFTSFYTGKTLGDLYTVLHTMPADNPGSLSDEKYADLLALILRTNGYPAGSAELPADAAALAAIQFVALPAK